MCKLKCGALEKSADKHFILLVVKSRVISQNKEKQVIKWIKMFMCFSSSFFWLHVLHWMFIWDNYSEILKMKKKYDILFPNYRKKNCNYDKIDITPLLLLIERMIILLYFHLRWNNNESSFLNSLNSLKGWQDIFNIWQIHAVPDTAMHFNLSNCIFLGLPVNVHIV